jgi:hypothetical protein
MAVDVTTTLNPADKGADITLSGGNLTASGTAVTNSELCRATGSASVKFYFEVNCTTFASGGNSGIGLCTASAIGSTLGSGPVQGALVYSGGALFATSTNSGKQIAALQGHTVQIAVDGAAKTFWARNVGTGTWNSASTGTDDPGTGSGGVSFATLTAPFFPVVCFKAASLCTVTANFGASPFAGIIPAGYTPAGYVAGGQTVRAIVLA